MEAGGLGTQDDLPVRACPVTGRYPSSGLGRASDIAGSFGRIVVESTRSTAGSRIIGVFPGKAFARPNLAQALPQRIEFGTRRGSRSGIAPQPVGGMRRSGSGLPGRP